MLSLNDYRNDDRLTMHYQGVSVQMCDFQAKTFSNEKKLQIAILYI